MVAKASLLQKLVTYAGKKVIMNVHYDRKTFIVQATGAYPRVEQYKVL